MKFFISGGIDFISSITVRHIIDSTKTEVMDMRQLVYVGKLRSLNSISNKKDYYFEQMNICHWFILYNFFTKYKPNALMHLVVESHAKKSIDFQIMLIKICIVIIPILLEIVLYCRIILLPEHDESFHFNDISTDEVYGDRHNRMLYLPN